MCRPPGQIPARLKWQGPLSADRIACETITGLQPKMAAEVTDEEMKYENQEKSQPRINTDETRITEELSRFRMLVCLELRPSASSADSPHSRTRFFSASFLK